MTNILQGAGGSRNPVESQSRARTQSQIMAAKKASFSQTDQGLSFPSDLSADYCFQMAMVEFEYNSKGQGGTSSGVPDQISGGGSTSGRAKAIKVGRNYFLPVPSSMKDVQGLDYSTIELGAVVGKLAGGIQDVANQIGIAQGAEEVGKVVGGAVGKAAKSVSSANKADAAAIIQAALGTGAFPRLAGIGGAILGQVPNPHVTSFFKGVKLKNYTFDWQLWPQSAEETTTIEKMINALKSDILPRQGDGNLGLTLKYPKEAHCQIHTLNGNRSHLKFKPAFVTDVSVDYTPQGPAFLENGHPAGIGLSISLQETSIWTAENYPDGLNLSEGAKNAARIVGSQGLQGAT